MFLNATLVPDCFDDDEIAGMKNRIGDLPGLDGIEVVHLIMNVLISGSRKVHALRIRNITKAASVCDSLRKG